MSKLTTIGLIALAALLLAVPIGIVGAEMPVGPSNAADSGEPPQLEEAPAPIVIKPCGAIGAPEPEPGPPEVAPPIIIEGVVGELDNDETRLPSGPALQQELRQEVGIAGSYYIPQHSLAAGRSHQWGPYFFTVGEIVLLSIDWSPRFSDTDLGVVRQATGEFISFRRTFGAGTVVIDIEESSFHYVRIRNRGPHRIWYSGFKII